MRYIQRARADGRVSSDPGSDAAVLVGMVATILLLHVVGIVLLVVAAGHDLRLSDGGLFGIGLGVTAYTLGMRHAFDADHIAAIDTTTRKLVGEGGRPLSVGFWFSLGHSTVVLTLCLLLAVGVRSLVGQVQDGGSPLQTAAGIVGSSVAALFLLTMGVVNLVSLVRIAALFRGMRDGGLDEDALDAELDRRGLMARVLRPVTRAVRRPLHMYPAGLLFGLGFDTATEISLLALAGGAALTLPWYAIVSLPILFTAGMCLFDTIDGVFMRRAYGWAFDRPVRKIYYNLTVTGLSVVVALAIGGIVLAGLVAERVGVRSGPVAFVARLDLDLVGYAIVALFVVAWVVSTLAWKVFRIEERWVRSSEAIS
jgi:high-affinity nickel-transport protein